MTLLKFYADWCGPCKVQDRHMTGLDYTPIDIETDDGKELAKAHQVTSIPTLLLLDEDGEVLHRATGITPRKVLDTWLS